MNYENQNVSNKKYLSEEAFLISILRMNMFMINFSEFIEINCYAPIYYAKSMLLIMLIYALYMLYIYFILINMKRSLYIVWTAESEDS